MGLATGTGCCAKGRPADLKSSWPPATGERPAGPACPQRAGAAPGPVVAPWPLEASAFASRLLRCPARGVGPPVKNKLTMGLPSFLAAVSSSLALNPFPAGLPEGSACTGKTAQFGGDAKTNSARPSGATGSGPKLVHDGPEHGAPLRDCFDYSHRVAALPERAGLGPAGGQSSRHARGAGRGLKALQPAGCSV